MRQRQENRDKFSLHKRLLSGDPLNNYQNMQKSLFCLNSISKLKVYMHIYIIFVVSRIFTNDYFMARIQS